MTLRGLLGMSSPIGRDAPSQPTQPMRILVIDDEEEDALLTRSALARIEGSPFRVDWVDTYEAGATAIARGEHGAYLVDHRLGGQTGIDLVREARAAGSCAPLIMLTGQRDAGTDQAALAAGATDFLVKGKTDPVLLDRTLRYAVTHARALETLDRAHRQLSGLEELGRLLSEEGPSSVALDRAVGLLASSFDTPYVALYVAAGDSLELAAYRGYRQPRRTIDASDAGVERVRRAGQPVMVPNMSIGTVNRDSGVVVAVELVVPLLVHGQLVGLLNAGSPTNSPIGAGDTLAIRVVADRITSALGLALERGRVEERLARARGERLGAGPAAPISGVREAGTGLFTHEFLLAFVDQINLDRTGVEHPVPQVNLVILGLSERHVDASEDVTSLIMDMAAAAFPDQMLARHSPSEISILVCGREDRDAARITQLMATGSFRGAEAVIAGRASLQATDDGVSLMTRAELAIAMARRMGPRTVFG